METKIDVLKRLFPSFGKDSKIVMKEIIEGKHFLLTTGGTVPEVYIYSSHVWFHNGILKKNHTTLSEEDLRERIKIKIE